MSGVVAETPAVMSAVGVSYAYSAKGNVIEDVSLKLEPGTLTTLLGPNGSGKSTLIKVLLDHVRASAGSIVWFDRPVQKWGRRAFAQRVAYLPQSPSASGTDTVGGVMRLGRSPHLSALGLETAEDVRIVGEVAELLGLTDLLEEPLAHLSGGQRQRVFVGRCLVQRPEVLLLDEPTTYLDLKHQLDLLQLLRSLAAEKGLTILMSSHDLNLAAAFSDRVLLLSGGRVAGYGGPGEVLTARVLSEVYGAAMTQVGRYVLPLLPGKR